MKQIMIIGASLLFLLVIQSTWLPVWLVAGIQLDLLLIATVCTGLLYGREKGVAVGFFSGLLQDLLSGFLFGYHILTRMLCGFACGLMEKQIFKENQLVPVAVTMLATVLTQVVYWGCAYLMGAGLTVGREAVVGLLLAAICNGLLAWPISKLFKWLFHVSETK